MHRQAPAPCTSFSDQPSMWRPASNSHCKALCVNSPTLHAAMCFAGKFLLISSTAFCLAALEIVGPRVMSDWRTSTLNSSLSSSQRLANRAFASSAQSLTGRTLPASRPLLSDDITRGVTWMPARFQCFAADAGSILFWNASFTCADKYHVVSVEENRSETQQAILNDTLTALKAEESRIEDDAWMYEKPRCTMR